jgi:uncharacterized protein (TIGR03435 family)
MLGSQLRRPVVDRTSLTGTYDFTLDFAFGDPAGPLEANAPAIGDGAANPAIGNGVASSAPSLMVALQEQLGLKLEERRAPTDVIVVDHAERTPAEN